MLPSDYGDAFSSMWPWYLAKFETAGIIINSDCCFTVSVEFKWNRRNFTDEQSVLYWVVASINLWSIDWLLLVTHIPVNVSFGEFCYHNTELRLQFFFRTSPYDAYYILNTDMERIMFRFIGIALQDKNVLFQLMCYWLIVLCTVKKTSSKNKRGGGGVLNYSVYSDDLYCQDSPSVQYALSYCK